ncbi:MAG: DUF4242 domain-containing protein [Actinobacteria bacterium]|jgi:hypothetical protein|nr:MAG: DUF4242 domain-containing protein [Actinomycetota bacterium]TMM26446.1 MAG: DUF4242 domain-containing protein [Actinomycetota bacterium]
MSHMPRYLVVRTFEVSEDAMPDVGRRSREIAEEEFPEIAWEHSHVIVDEVGGVRTFCVYGAPDPETVRSHGERLGQHTIDDLWEIAGDVTPADFPSVS